MARSEATRQRIALIRGINVGRAKRVAMADLRALVESLGYSDARTLLNSGNVVFTAPGTTRVDDAARIERAMPVKLGVAARVFVLTAAELAKIVADNPLLKIARDPSRLFITVLARATDRKHLQPLAREDWAPGVLALGVRVAYLWCPEGQLESRMALAVGRALGDAGTVRNWSTILKLQALVDARG